MKLVSFLAAAILAFGVAVAAEAPTKPIVLEAKQGKVTFDHTKHKGVACEKCHPPFQMFSLVVDLSSLRLQAAQLMAQPFMGDQAIIPLNGMIAEIAQHAHHNDGHEGIARAGSQFIPKHDEASESRLK